MHHFDSCQTEYKFADTFDLHHNLQIAGFTRCLLEVYSKNTRVLIGRMGVRKNFLDIKNLRVSRCQQVNIILLSLKLLGVRSSE